MQSVRHTGQKQLSNEAVHLLRLACRGDHPGTDRPNRFISDHTHSVTFLRRKMKEALVQLLFDQFKMSACSTVIQFSPQQKMGNSDCSSTRSTFAASKG